MLWWNIRGPGFGAKGCGFEFRIKTVSVAPAVLNQGRWIQGSKEKDSFSNNSGFRTVVKWIISREQSVSAISTYTD